MRALILAALLAGCAAAGAAEPAPKLISNNDMTNWALFAPGPKPMTQSSAQEVRDAVAASLRFTASPGVEAISFSPLYSTFPFWRSALYTLADHDKFLRALPYYQGGKEAGFPGPERSPMRRALDEGFDFARFFEDMPLKAANGRPIDKILSYRVDDAHFSHIYDVFSRQTRAQVFDDVAAKRSPICNSRSLAGAEETETWSQTAFTGYFEAFATGKLPKYLDNRCVAGRCLSAEEVARDCAAGACLVRTEGSKCPEVTLNFRAAAVRRYKLMQIEDLVTAAKPKTLELDFDRWPQLFDEATPIAERQAIVGDWLRQVRRSIPGVRLGLRVESRIAHRAAAGIDLREIARAGLADYAIIAMPYFWDPQPETEIEPAASPIPLYFEVTQETGAPPADKKLLESFGLTGSERYVEQLSTARRLVTGANLAWRRGFYGLAMFNMQYYLRLASGAPPVEYPAEAILCMSKPECAAASDQEYVLPLSHYHLAYERNMLPAFVRPRRPAQFSLRLAPPAKGWTGEALVFVGFTLPKAEADPRRDYAEAKAALSVRLNGRPMNATEAEWPADPGDGEKLAEHYRRYWLNAAPFHKIFAAPARDLVDGVNTVEVEWSGPAAPAVEAKMLDFRLFAPAAR